ncbi:MAG: DUF1638 domain-containing protein [Chloroflexota bacterium]|nr:DUF1638 domain-containing protein [Chloroflexota bacterium]
MQDKATAGEASSCRPAAELSRTKVLACATVIEEILPILPPQVRYQILDFGLHTRPGELKRVLQEAIDQSGADSDFVLLGYGLCSLAVVGLEARNCTLVIPRSDDCIGLFLGSRDAYRKQARLEPGTYYLTKGWIEVGDSPFSRHQHLVERYGEPRASRMIQFMLKNYKRLAFINTGQYEIEQYREHARKTSEQFGLRFEEIDGAPDLMRKLILGPWDGEFLVVPPGNVIRYEDFSTVPQAAPSHG